MRPMPVFVLSLVFAVPLLAVVVKSQIGLAIADAIRHNSGANEGAAVRNELEQMHATIDELRGELEQVRAELIDAHERLDFAERMLSKGDTPVRGIAAS